MPVRSSSRFYKLLIVSTHRSAPNVHHSLPALRSPVRPACWLHDTRTVETVPPDHYQGHPWQRDVWSD